jgi:Flp pilus assembly protein TadD
MLNAVMKAQTEEIFLTPSVVSKPVIRMSNQKGIGLSVIDALSLSKVADSLQEQMGYRPARVGLHLFSEGSTVKVLVTGYETRRWGTFEQEVVQVKDERVVSLVKRATIVAMATIDPYMTALNLMRRHIKDKDFKGSEDVIAFAKARLGTAKINTERSMLENLEGMIALFRRDTPRANERFQTAMESNPGNHVAILNLALTKLEMDKDAEVEVLVSKMLKDNPPDDPVILATAHLTLSAAYLGLRQPGPADTAIAKAAELNPTNPTVLASWAEVKQQIGDKEAAARLIEQSRAVQNENEDYAEVAALYFSLSWEKGEPVLRSPFDPVATAPDTAEKTAPTAPQTATKTEPAKEIPPAAAAPK